MSSSVAFSGTYTQNQGEAAAAGTVSITPYGQSATVATLDASGHYSASVPFAGPFTVVETLTGVPVRTLKVRGIDGAVVDTGRDIGTVQGGSSGSIGSVAGLTAALAAKQDLIQSGTFAKPATSGSVLPTATVVGQRFLLNGTPYESLDGSTWTQMGAGVNDPLVSALIFGGS